MISKMKKIYLILGMILFITCATGCSETGQKNTWFSEQTLQSYMIPNLPQIELDDAILIVNDDNSEFIYFNFSLENVNKYASLVLNYLLTNKDIHNISIMDSFVIENEEKIWIYNKINFDYIFNDRGYNFAYSLTSETVNIDKRVYMKEAIIISVVYSGKQMLYPGYNYSAYIKIYKTQEKIVLQ